MPARVPHLFEDGKAPAAEDDVEARLREAQGQGAPEAEADCRREVLCAAYPRKYQSHGRRRGQYPKIALHLYLLASSSRQMLETLTVHPFSPMVTLPNWLATE